MTNLLSSEDLSPLATATVTIKIDKLSGGRVGVGVFTEGKGLDGESAQCMEALLDTLQDFCTGNEIPVNVRRIAQ